MRNEFYNGHEDYGQEEQENNKNDGWRMLEKLIFILMLLMVALFFHKEQEQQIKIEKVGLVNEYLDDFEGDGLKGGLNNGAQ